MIAFVGVAGHSVEAVDLMHRLIALPHRQSRLDEVIANAMMTMTQFNLGNIDVALDYVRRAITGSDLLRLPIIRVQMRWMTGELAHWLGDFAAAKREYAAAATFHLQTELYTAGTTDLAIHTLLWDQGALATLSGPEFAERKAWQATFAAVRGDVDEAETRVAEWLDEARHPVWTTLGHQVLVAHVLADIGRPARATQLLALLSPFSDRLANIGQVGHVGPVSLAIARLQVLIGDLAAARAALTQAIDLCERARGLASLLRCRLLEAELETGEAQREALLRNVISETARLGMAGVEAQARRLLLTS